MVKPPDPFTEHTLELLAHIPGIHAKRMFSGQGLFHDDLMFALTCDGELFFKVDDQNRASFENQGLEPFRYEKKDGKVFTMSYYEAPEECFASPAKMKTWAAPSIEAAQRAAKLKKPKKKKKPRS
ncbi:MAG: TfoX/Sxy family protein [Verrucomicrobiota bacterium]